MTTTKKEMSTEQAAFEAAQAKADEALAHMEAVRHEAPVIADAAWRAYCEANDLARTLRGVLTG